DADPNRASMRTEVYGVLQQCLDNLVYLQWIRLDNGRCRQFWSDSDGALSSVSGGVADHLPDYGAQIRHGIPKVPLAGLHGTQCAHLLYEVMQGDGALVYHVQEHAPFLGSHLSLCPEHLEGCQHAVQRCACFMPEQCEDIRCALLHFLKRSEAHMDPHFCHEFLFIKGFGDIVVSPGLIPLQALRNERPGGYHDDFNMAEGRMCPDPPTCLVAPNPRHHNVQEDESRLEVQRHDQRLFSTGGRLQRIVLPQDFFQDGDISGMVIDNKNTGVT